MLSRSAILVFSATVAHAQSIKGAVLAKREPHHHVAYEDSNLRVLRVRVPAHDSTLLHEHDPDYFWIALGASTVVNAKLGAPEATISSADLSIHYTFGNFAHVARNPGTIPFDNITVELLEPQSNVRNLCELALADKPLDCPAESERTSDYFSGATEHPAVTTARTRVSLLTIAPGSTVKPKNRARSTWMIALDTADTRAALVVDGAKWIGGSFRAPATAWSINNRGRAPVHVIAVVAP
jgi:hypothetical protein